MKIIYMSSKSKKEKHILINALSVETTYTTTKMIKVLAIYIIVLTVGPTCYTFDMNTVI